MFGNIRELQFYSYIGANHQNTTQLFPLYAIKVSYICRVNYNVRVNLQSWIPLISKNIYSLATLQDKIVKMSPLFSLRLVQGVLRLRFKPSPRADTTGKSGDDWPSRGLNWGLHRRGRGEFHSKFLNHILL